MTFHEPSMLNYQAEYIRKNECWVCHGSGRVRVDDEYNTGPCSNCEGTGKATDKDRERLKIHDDGICLICKMPHVEGHSSTSKYEPSGSNDCLDHLRQYVLELEGRLAKLEGA